jgi:N-acyl-D-amino-acid deacylase
MIQKDEAMKKSMTRRNFTKTTALATAGLFVGCSVKNQYDVIIKNGLIVDGFGTPGIKKDIGINGDTISVIDQLGDKTADLIIDANNLVVSPGFIDIHTHTDTRLLIDFRGVSKVTQGITTEVSGNCGSSPFPKNESDLKELDENLYERFGIHANWNDLNDYLKVLEESKVSINYATFTGQGTLRSFAVGKNDVPPTSEQMEKMKKALEKSMKEGSFGLSSGLEYAPGSYADTQELIELCKVVADNGGIYNTHMRNEDDRVIEAIEEAIKIGKEAQVPVELAHLKACNKSNWHKVDQMLELISTANEQGLPISADRYPYVAYGTGLSTFLPLWSRQGESELLINERMSAGIVGFAMDEDNLKKVLSSPLVMIGSDGSTAAPDGKLATGKPHPRFYGTFPRVLGKYCREEKCFDLPTAVKKMTTMPAEKIGLKKRGSIIRGNFADITIFNPKTVIDKATFTDPHQVAVGIEYVLVNGKMVIDKGNHTGSKSGSIIRHSV